MVCIAMLITAGACQVDPSSKSWDVSSSPHKVIIFPVSHIPID
jgi:hypothetical protein